MKRHTAALILPYYGKFPNYFPLWLKSAGANPEFTFMIFTDIDMSEYKIPANVQVHAMTLEEIRQRAGVYLDFEPVLDRPYKLCDYKPLYGLIFEEYLVGYDFWGFCDCDLIWGDMSRFITDDMLDRYDRLYRNGFLQLLRNNGEICRFVLHDIPNWNISYRDVYTVNRIMGFDEFEMPQNLFSTFTQGGGGQYYAREYADIFPFKKEFCWKWGSEKVVPAFRWKDGRVTALSFDGKPGLNVEFMFIHLQKRSMNFTPGLENENSFMVIPNEFVKDHELTPEETQALMTPDPEFEQAQRAKYPGFGVPVKPSILQRIKHRLNIVRRAKNLIKKLLTLYVKNDPEKILELKQWWNRFRGRSLPLQW